MVCLRERAGQSQGVLLVLLCLLLTSCTSIGPRTIRINRGLYNDVVLETENEQLLKNIVRLRYAEPTYFMKITNVTTSFSFASSIASNSPAPNYSYATIGSAGVATTFSQMESVGIVPTLSYADSPTISYQPVESQDFVNALLTSLTLAELQMLFAGRVHDFLYISRLVLSAIGNVENAASMTSRKVAEIPEYKDYYKVMQLIDLLRRRGDMYIMDTTLQKDYAIIFRFHSAAGAASPAALKLKKYLNVPQNADSIVFSDKLNYCGSRDLSTLLLSSERPTYNCPPSKLVHVEIRSVFQIMRALSFGVRVPEQDIQAGYVEQLRYSDGRLFNWEPLTDGIMTVYSSDSEPKDAYVKTYAHNHWFYIKNTDLNSKTTLAFLLRLIDLVAGGSAGSSPNNAPVLTLPVNIR